ncbi:sensor histidine kinase [Paenibacillus amylolyticus]|jgi:two-component system sensor histidine kinase YesM|uniref:histidine kinase n=1 Tax=Paenibacillus amylolyticus TaxID=1451 RepID=A0A5M9WZH5_PAEAM|nr:sensor histidine kinase [Paenibacillus amylolyticus]KAA8786942.1 sensor histidine kinase [Paenibacillus amylolyticus]
MKWLKRLQNHYSQSIQVKLTCYFLLILLPLVAFSIYANVKSRQILEQELGERTISAMSSGLEFVDLTLGSIKNLSTLISTDSNLLSLLSHEEETLSPGAIMDFSRVIERITDITAVNDYLSNVMIYHHASSSLMTTKLGLIHLDSSDSERWHADALKANGASIYYLPDRYKETMAGRADSIYNRNDLIMMRLLDFYRVDKSENVLMLSISKSKLLRSLSSLVEKNQSKLYLYDDQDRMIVSNAADEPQSFELHEVQVDQIIVQDSLESNEKNMILRVTSPRSGWSILLVQPEKEVYMKSKPLEIFTYGIIVLSVVLAFWIAWLVYSGISSPISGLVSGMRQLRKGNLNIQLENKRQDELGFLTDSFNQTVTQQRHLIKDIYEQQLRMTKTELKLLQAQINPHFLYNTLDSIYWTAKNYDAEEISTMVLNLSSFFRLSLSKGQETFTVEETFKHLHYYVRIQQIRFSEQFTITYHASENSRHLHILKLLLQPLVENAILHGLEKRKKGGTLNISTNVIHDRLVIQVSDNGRGIPKERLDQIQEALALIKKGNITSPSERNSSFFALLNVQARIGIYYGETADLIIESIEGEGTTATMKFPVNRCSKDRRESEHEPNDC